MTMMLGEPKPEVSVVIENYLQAIFKLMEQEERVVPTRLAEAMNVSVATAVGTLKRLTAQGMIEDATKGKMIKLTPKGKDLAESVVRRHRLAERMLVEILGLDWHKAHREAHRLEHAISPEVEQLLLQVLGYPETNPFGRPIPGYGSNPASLNPLIEAGEGETVLLQQVPEEDMTLLAFLDSNNLKPGIKVTVKEMAAFKGTVTLDVAGEDVVLGTEVAQKIMVGPSQGGQEL